MTQWLMVSPHHVDNVTTTYVTYHHNYVDTGQADRAFVIFIPQVRSLFMSSFKTFFV